MNEAGWFVQANLFAFKKIEKEEVFFHQYNKITDN